MNMKRQSYFMHSLTKNRHVGARAVAFAFAFAFAFNAVDLDLPESSIPFSKSCQRLAEAPWMARRALPHRMCDQRVPVDDMILKIAAGNPQGRISAKSAFGYFSRSSKSDS